MLEAILSTETSVLTKAKRHHIPEDGILNLFEVCVKQYLTNNNQHLKTLQNAY
jgi:hypothetical protein